MSNETNRAEFFARLNNLIEFASTNQFRGATYAVRALRRLRNSAALRSAR